MFSETTAVYLTNGWRSNGTRRSDGALLTGGGMLVSILSASGCAVSSAALRTSVEFCVTILTSLGWSTADSLSHCTQHTVHTAHTHSAHFTDGARDRWHHVTLKGEGHDTNMPGVHYLRNGWTAGDTNSFCYNGAPIGNGTRVSNGHVTSDIMWPWKIKFVAQIYLDANFVKIFRDSIGQTPCSWNIILFNKRCDVRIW